MRSFDEVFQPFVAEVKAAIGEETVVPRILNRVHAALVQLVSQKDVDWPNREGLWEPYYVDPKDLFAICCGWDRHRRSIDAHDHGELGWAVYGVVSGRMVNQLFDRLDDGSVPGKADLRKQPNPIQLPGEAVIVPPGGIHETHCEEDAYVVVIRSRDAAYTWKSRFKPDEGTVIRVYGRDRQQVRTA